MGLLIRFSHEFLYKNILKNAGRFRDAKDKNLGKVYFGGEKQRSLQYKFEGAPPNEIIAKVVESLACLFEESEQPIECALHFYQKFVLCHPYYDANGRIARFIVNVYLNYQDMVVDWEHLLDNKLFIKHLNNCHRRAGQPKEFGEYFRFLVKAFRKHVREKKDLENCATD